MSTSDTDLASLPAYRHKWFWIIISPILMVWVACAITITIALNNKDDVVIGNYYKEGLLVNEKNEQQRLAESLGIQGELAFEFFVAEVVLRFSADSAPADHVWPEIITLTLSHPAFAAQDETIELQAIQRDDNYVYVGDVPQTLEGRWYWHLLPREGAEQSLWKLKGEIDFAKTSVVALDSFTQDSPAIDSRPEEPRSLDTYE